MKVRRIGISNKILIAVVVVLLLSDGLIGGFIYNKAQSMLLSQIKSSALNIAACVSESVDAEALSQVAEGDGPGVEPYDKVVEELTVFLENAGVEYVYTIRYNDAGEMVFAVDSDPEEPGMPGDEFDYEPAAEAALKGVATAGDRPYTDEWGTHLSVYTPINLDGKTIAATAVDISMDWINEQERELLILIIVICSIVFAVSLLITFIFSRVISKNFKNLNGKISDLVSGNGDLTRQIEIKSGDEFEVIGNNINLLIGHIREIMINISGESDSLKNSTENISESLNAARSSVSDVSSNLHDMSASMEESSASLAEVSELMDSISTSFADMVSQIGDGSRFSNEIRNEAEETGKKARAEQADAKKRSEAMGEAVGKKIEKSKAVEHINTLTERILSISKQTNLLALNASIEAARAGEAGKGFAVVATEIGDLADDSAKAASEIQQVSSEVIGAVNELAEESNKMLKFMEEVALNGYNDLVVISEDFGEKANRFADLMSNFETITAAIDQDIEKINASTGMVSNAVESSARDVVSAAEKAAEMNDQMGRIGDDAAAEVEISEALYGEVNKFKL